MDYVAMPLHCRPDHLAIGRVVGRYRYRPDAPADQRHTRAVEWINTAVPRHAIQSDLLNSLGSIMTICGLPSDPDGRRLGALVHGESDPGRNDSEDEAAVTYASRSDLVSVLDVGDGACTVVRSLCDGNESVMVIDCGSDSISADEVCSRLLEALEGRPELIDTIVVTHFDTDHYLGFVRLAERMRARGQRFRSMRLISPRIPEIAQEYVWRYLALASTVTGIRNLDLALSLREVTDGPFRYAPAARGLDGAFVAGQHGYEVLWPLPVLPAGLVRQVQSAVTRFDQLADALAGSGNTSLRDNLETARAGGWLQTELQSNLMHLAGRSELDIGEFDEDDDAYEDLALRDISQLNLPEDHSEEFRGVWDAMRRANNNMSLVFENAEPGRLIVFGDAGAPVLSWLAKTGLSPAHVSLMLAPHHGTHRLPAGLQVTADLCVGQNGRKRGHLWPRHLATHPNPGHCVSSTAGTHHLLF
ncbi:MBL fold metallo-hydrolase [Asanoa hainanensis]|uniref:MBL fold metallo-hydrolase n=1 Tax=Asanoa hainanensis TaxID=560556 RepID=UPI0015C67555|nr:MBL fold metallo-hydrolase [Asanoa hainanensis]